MPDTILVVVEQREGKLNRVSWETITAGQAIAAATGWSLEAAVVGSGASSIAAEVAAKKVAKVYVVESAKLEPYTPDAFAAALKQFLAAKQPKLVLMPHTYQVRDFVPRSEEHPSQFQSLSPLVCRLLLVIQTCALPIWAQSR